MKQRIRTKLLEDESVIGVDCLWIASRREKEKLVCVAVRVCKILLGTKESRVTSERQSCLSSTGSLGS
jgi:hypothetical protein